LVDEDIFYCIVLEFNRDDHGVVLLVVNAMEIIVCKGNGRHATSVVGVGYVVNRLELAEMFLSS